LTVTGGATFVYDGDGNRVKKTEGSQTILYINHYYEKNMATGVVTTSYYLGGQLVATSEGTTLRYVHQDSLGSTSTMSASDGTAISSIAYFPFGLTRTGSVNTTKEFTGQRLDSTGLYYYNARYYDPQIGRFISPDATGQDLNNPQTLNRYSYCVNNPLKYTDPSGHFIQMLVGALIGAAGYSITHVAANLITHKQWNAGWDWKAFATATAIGAISGGISELITVAASAALSTTVTVGGEVSSAVEPVVTETVNETNQVVDTGWSIDQARDLGKMGEELSGITRNTDHIPSFTGTAAFRVPDGLTDTVLSEVKNVNYQGYTSQIQDYLKYSQDNEITFELWTRPDTIISKPLQNLIDNGDIIQKYLDLYSR